MKDNEEIIVSIVCCTYNHEEYIRNAMDGFIMQKTNFKFEVIVHDDASTDRTAEIIREYELKYPDLIKPIYQKINQYSNNKSNIRKSIVQKIRGKYVALCEGDDYWTDPYKLEIQLELMKKMPEINICAHTALVIDANSKKKTGMIRAADHNGILPVEKVILGGGALLATNSLFMKTDVYINIMEFRKSMNIDYSLQIQGSIDNGIYYIDRCMSVYRYMSRNSWSRRVFLNNKKLIEWYDKEITMLDILNEETKYKYNDAIIKKKRLIMFSMEIAKKNYVNCFDKELREVLKQQSFKKKVKLSVLCIIQFLKGKRYRNN